MGQRQGKTSGTVTAKSQVLAVCCAPVVARRPASSRSGHRSPAESMVQWCQSAAIVRAWAEDWVLRPSREAVFRLPISDPEGTGRQQYLFVSVSLTLGVVENYWMTCGTDTMVCGCLGHKRVLCAHHTDDARGTRFYYSDVRDMAVESLDAKNPKDPAKTRLYIGGSLDSRVFTLRCNRRWIVRCALGNEICVWKVPSESPTYFRDVSFGVEAARAEFSPICDDVVIMCTTSESTGFGCIIFADLDASCGTQHLVVTSKVMCGCCLPEGYMWLTGGSLCTLDNFHPSMAYCLVDCATQKILAFPKRCQFHVYHTGNNLTAPSLSVPCTWARPSTQSGLIASTTQRPVADINATEILITVHDGPTGFRVGKFAAPLPSTFLSWDSSNAYWNQY
ncbi:hypothetical protein Pelo_11699 [Pelomyxa schiedti]|nr:hypothetical protein Pelo_11699 [Pelomyxa schiedti]